MSDAQQPVFQIQRVYLKDLSLEQPNSPQILIEQGQPQVDINLGVEMNPVQDGIFEVAVTGTVTTKLGELESPDDLKRRIDEAARIVPLGQLALSPQCGFSSTHHGNALSMDDQWRKLERVVEVARDVWR